MSEIWKDGSFAADEWAQIADGEDLPSDQPALVSLQRWRQDREALAGRNAAVGLVLEPDSEWDDIRADLQHIPVVAINFPKYADGRGFSFARLLRDRDGYGGEIRAIGDYFVDQMPYLRRVGIDAFVVSDPQMRKALQAGLWPEVPLYLQPVDENSEVPEGTRPWARRPAASD